MAFAIIQAGSALQLLNSAGVLSTLTLPSGVTLRSDIPPRWQVSGRNVILVNTPSQPLAIDETGTVRLLTPRPPRMAPVLTGPNAGGLTGTYRGKVTHRVRDAIGNILSESDYSPASAAVTIAAKSLLASNLDISPDDITERGLYRTTTDGAVYFEWVDLDGNVLSSVQDDLSDAGLALLAAPVLGTPPRLVTIASFRGRLFGTGDIDRDTVRYTEAGLQYAWPEDNTIPIAGAGADEFGIVGLLPRKDALGVGRRNLLAQITGTGDEDANGGVDLNPVTIATELGLESQEAMNVFRDTAFFLWKDGVYSWGADGIRCVSDGVAGVGNVRTWFASGDYFNRDRFPYAFSVIDPNRPCYRLFLASSGQTTIDRWVEYDIKNRTWWGPHKTDLFSPTSAFARTNAANRVLPVIGGAVAVYDEQDTRTDGSATAITFNVLGKRHDGGAPDLEKAYGDVSIFGKGQSAGTLTVTSRTGELNATATFVQSHDLTLTRERLKILGTGKHTQVELSNAEAGRDVELYEYLIQVNPIGRR